MSDVWLCIPSARPSAEVAARMAKWTDRGYLIALHRDGPDDTNRLKYHLCMSSPYPGYALAVNRLIQQVMRCDLHADWFVTGGDDVDPDPTKTADEIASECTDSFCSRITGLHDHRMDTFGVMQPTGDRWGDRQGAYIDRVAGSPWIGREFARRAYGGNGPYWPEYTHMGVDEELQAVATKLGVFWQRPDLIHMHDHWGRPRPGELIGQRSRMPAFLEEANSPAEWRRYKELFAARAAAGFPGSEVIP